MKPPKPPAPRTWSYARAFHLTMGLMLLGVMSFVWISEGHESKGWPFYVWILLSGVAVTGLVAIGLSLASSDKWLKQQVSHAKMNPGEIAIAIVAAPVYWIGILFVNPRRRQPKRRP